MEEEDVVASHLRSKLSSILREAQEDPNSPSRIVWRFQSIEKQIYTMSSIPVDLLYELIDSLSECRIFPHRRRRHKAAPSKKPFFRVPNFTDFFFYKKMIDRLDNIETKLRNTPGPSSIGSPLTQRTYPVLDASHIVGFESEAEEIEAWLMANNSSAATAIGILGQRSGCGKTALAQKVFACSRIEEEFCPRIWVCLSNMVLGMEQRVRFVTYILEKIGYNVSELEEVDFSVVKLLEKLKRELMGKRYLIVLDDAWREDEWFADLGCGPPRGDPMGEFFSHGLPKESGGAVIVTSQWESVIKRMVGDKHVIRLETSLSDESCWNIFSHHVRRQGIVNSDHPKLNELKEDVVRKCDGLPLAAEILADTIPNLLQL